MTINAAPTIQFTWNWMPIAPLLGIAVGTILNVQVANSTLDSAETAGNTPPFLSEISDLSAPEDTVTSTVPIFFGDAETPVSELRLAAASSNERLIPSENVLFSEGTPTRLVAVPLENQSGDTTITVTVTDAQGATASRRFRVTIQAVNDPLDVDANPENDSLIAEIRVLASDTPAGLSIRQSSQNTLQLGPPAHGNYILQCSTDLINWSPLTPPGLDPGATSVSLSTSTYPPRFFRVVPVTVEAQR